MWSEPKRLVYVLVSLSCASRYYVGLTSDVQARLVRHNSKHCSHTSKHGPWELSVVVQFADEPRARRFEKYLKSGSGRAFAKRHF